MKLSLEAQPLAREVTAINLSVSRFSKEAWQQMPVATKIQADGQLQFPEPLQHSDMPLTLMLQRFMLRLDGDSVVTAIASDQHIPEQSGSWLPIIQSGRSVIPVVPVNLTYTGAYTASAGLVAGLALRTFSAPKAVLVQLKGDQPDALALEGHWYRIKEITLPERLSGLWWQQPVRKSYYIALMAAKDGFARTPDGCTDSILVLLVHDHESDGWYVNGIYD